MITKKKKDSKIKKKIIIINFLLYTNKIEFLQYKNKSL